MTKQEQFLWIVQTAILTNGINLTATTPETAEKYRHVYSATGVLGTLDDAIYASERIPQDMSAGQAGHEFCHFMLQNLRDLEEEAEGASLQVPSWFARH